MATKKTTTHELTDDDADAIFNQVMTCEPAVPKDKLEDLANLVFSKERVIRNWRLAALLGSKDGTFFKELSTDEEQAKALAAAVDPLRDAAQLLRGMAEIMDCVSARVMVAGCNHRDSNAWMEVDHG